MRWGVKHPLRPGGKGTEKTRPRKVKDLSGTPLNPSNRNSGHRGKTGRELTNGAEALTQKKATEKTRRIPIYYSGTTKKKIKSRDKTSPVQRGLVKKLKSIAVFAWGEKNTQNTQEQTTSNGKQKKSRAVRKNEKTRCLRRDNTRPQFARRINQSKRDDKLKLV